MSNVITPTVGRKVWYRPGPQDSAMVQINGQPLDATVVAVWNSGYVNLVIFDAYGEKFSRTSIQLLQDGDETPEGRSYAEWMPYQKAQPARDAVLTQLAPIGSGLAAFSQPLAAGIVPLDPATGLAFATPAAPLK